MVLIGACTCSKSYERISSGLSALQKRFLSDSCTSIGLALVSEDLLTATVTTSAGVVSAIGDRDLSTVTRPGTGSAQCRSTRLLTVHPPAGVVVVLCHPPSSAKE